MADGIQLNASTSVGDTINADDIGGEKIPGGKMILGPNNTNDGYVSKANPMPAGANTVKDGSGTELRPLVDADGHFQVDVLSATSLPLPSGASTSAKQDTANTALAAIASALGGTLPVSAVSLPLPSGAATEAKQDTGNTSIASIDTKTPALGQAVAGGSVPVVLPAAQITTLTPPAAITGFATSAKQDTMIGHIDGLESSFADAVTALQIIDDWDQTNRCAVNLIVGQAGVSAGAGTVDVTTIRTTSASDDPAVTALAAIQTAVQLLDNAVSGNELQVDVVSSALPTGAATAAKQPALGTAGAASTDVITVQGIASGTAQPISGSLTSVAVISSVSALAGSSISHDTADSGSPHKIGAKATTSLAGLTLVADADRTNLFAGVDGVIITRPHCNLEDIVSGNASNTDGTSTSLIAAQASGIKTYLTSIILTNTSATDIYVEIKDGTTVKLTIPVPANSGAVVNLPVPIGGTAATAWNFDPSAAATTIYCSAVGFKSKV